MLSLFNYLAMHVLPLAFLYTKLPLPWLASTINNKIIRQGANHIWLRNTLGVMYCMHVLLASCLPCLYVWISNKQASGFINNNLWLPAFILTQIADCFIIPITSDLSKSGVNTGPPNFEVWRLQASKLCESITSIHMLTLWTEHLGFSNTVLS